MVNNKIIKVTLEYKDHIEYLEGKDAQEWFKAADSCIAISTVHGFPMADLPWKEVKK